MYAVHKDLPFDPGIPPLPNYAEGLHFSALVVLVAALVA